MVHEARGDNKQAADGYRKAIEIIRGQPANYDPEFAAVFVKLVDKLDPPTNRQNYLTTTLAIGYGREPTARVDFAPTPEIRSSNCAARLTSMPKNARPAALAQLKAGPTDICPMSGNKRRNKPAEPVAQCYCISIAYAGVRNK
jgi:hypothetical protein